MLGRRMIIHETFFENNWTDSSLIRRPSKKYISTTNKELSDIVATIKKIEPKKCTTNGNISREEEIALNEIKALSRTEIEIKKADKTSTLVIMNKDDYCNQLVIQCHLETNAYEQVTNNIDSKVYKKL